MRLFENPNTFANNPLDRASHLRGDAGKLAALRNSPGTRLAVLHGLKPLLRPGRTPEEKMEVLWLRPGLIEAHLPEAVTTVFLGMMGETAHFALDISSLKNPENQGPLEGFGKLFELRGAAPHLAPGDAAILAQAKAMIDWHHRHRFCANCGAPTELADAGYKRQCHSCSAEHFPRTDPVTIMLAVHGDECLLGRGKNWPGKFYSALAGFLEPGETIEEGVARELREEAGVVAHTVHYRFTQPWPYPSSLMIGCVAEVASRELVIDGTELADAKWFSRERLRDLLAGKDPEGLFAPPQLAIAHQLIKDWLERG